jgi:FtsH-binding integral membrane protein
MVQDYDTGGTFRPLGARTDTGTLFGRTMGLVAVTVGLFAMGAYPARNLSGGAMACWIASFVCLLAMNITVRRSEQLTLGLLFGFGLLVGLATAPTISYYANVDLDAVWEAGGATALFVAGFGAAGYATRRDPSVLARVLWWALIALIGFGMLLIFFSIPAGSVIYALLGLVIFAGLVMYDLQRLRVSTHSTAPRCWRPRSFSTSSTSSSSSSRCSVGGAVDGSHRATDDAPT